MLLCPWVDLSCALQTRQADETGSDAAREEARRAAALYLAGHPADDPIVSPLTADLTGLPPMLVQAATGDHVLQEVHELTDHARRLGVDARLELYPVDTHGFHIFWSFLPEAADALRQAGRFACDIRAADSTTRALSGTDVEPDIVG